MANVKATDLIDFTRASKGHALAKVSYGEELVENGTFDSDLSGWTVVSGSATVTNGEAVVSYDGANGGLSQYITVEVGKLYEIKASLTATTSSGPRLKIGTTNNGNDIKNITIVADVFEKFVATTTTISIFAQAIGDGSTTIDNISVKEVLFNQPDGTLQLFEHPNNIPRIEYDADGNLLGLLIEEARTNGLPYSEDFTEWTQNQSSVVENDAIAPDKTTTADAIVKTNAVNVFWSRRETFIFSTNTTYTLSVFAKAIDANYLMLRQVGEANGRTWFDLSTGTVGTQQSDIESASIEEYDNDWFRCSITFTTGSSISNNLVDISFFQADGSTLSAEGVSGYVWGAQLEQGSFPTSYIKTTGSTVTRSADVASIDVDQFGYNQSEGTVVVHAQAFGRDAGAYPRVVELNDGTASNRIMFFPLDSLQLQVQVSGSTQAALDGGAIVYNQFSKYAGGIKAGDFNLSLDGSPVVSDTSGSMPAVTELRVGADHTGSSNFLNGHIKSITYTPKRLSNAKLQELTS